MDRETETHHLCPILVDFDRAQAELKTLLASKTKVIKDTEARKQSLEQLEKQLDDFVTVSGAIGRDAFLRGHSDLMTRNSLSQMPTSLAVCESHPEQVRNDVMGWSSHSMGCFIGASRKLNIGSWA